MQQISLWLPQALVNNERRRIRFDSAMNPGTVLGQAIATGLLLSVLCGLGRPTLALGLALLGLMWWLALDFLYARALGMRGRTARRRTGDHAVALQVSIGYGMPMLASSAFLVWGWKTSPAIGPVSANEVQAIVGTVGAMLVVWLGSSHLDWYYIRPRIDGVVCEPPCRTSQDSKWKGVTRKWYIHRAIATLATMVALVILAVVVAVVLYRKWPTALSAVGGATPILGVTAIFLRNEIRNTPATIDSIRNPRHWLGDDLKYRTDNWNLRGYVLHVAIPVTKLVPLDRETGARQDKPRFKEEPAWVLDAALLEPLPFNGCAAGCQHLNPECTFAQEREDQGERNWLVF